MILRVLDQPHAKVLGAFSFSVFSVIKYYFVRIVFNTPFATIVSSSMLKEAL